MEKKERKSWLAWIKVAGLMLFVSTLAACGGGGGSAGTDGNSSGGTGGSSASYTISGTAAIGKAFQGSINAYGRNGGNKTGIQIGTDGKYSIELSGIAPPFLLEAVPDDPTQGRLYSLAIDSGVANLTQLTTLAIYIANNQQDPASLATTWASNAIAVSGKLPEAQKTVNANFLQAFKDIDPSLDIDFMRYNFFSEEFSIGDTLDRILDLLSVEINGNSLNVAINGVEYLFDATLNNFSVSIPGVYGSLSIKGDDAIATGGDFFPENSVYSSSTPEIVFVTWQSIFIHPNRGVNLGIYNGNVAFVNYSVSVIGFGGSITSYSYQIDCYNPASGNSGADPDCSKIKLDTDGRRLELDGVALKNISTTVGGTFGSNGATAPLIIDGALIWTQ